MGDPHPPLKLPIKRKTPSSNSSPSSTPQLQLQLHHHLNHLPSDLPPAADLTPPPFKFQRIWPEADETRLLQALLDSAADRLTYPRDLSLFYDRFSASTAHPYTKSQLSEKLRRLRKKFHALSARLATGLDSALLTPHDRSLFHLSKLLWHPSFAASSPFSASIIHRQRKPPAINHHASTPPPAPLNLEAEIKAEAVKEEEEERNSPPNELPEVANVKERDEDVGGGPDKIKMASLPSGGIAGLVVKTVMDVFDGALEEVRTTLDHASPSTSSTSGDLHSRWRGQRALEFDALSRRLRIVLEESLRQYFNTSYSQFRSSELHPMFELATK